MSLIKSLQRVWSREGEESYEPLHTDHGWGGGGGVMSPPGVLMLTGGYSLITSEAGQWLSSPG